MDVCISDRPFTKGVPVNLSVWMGLQWEGGLSIVAGGQMAEEATSRGDHPICLCRALGIEG